ncbi:MAG: hypothetical protein K2N48_01180 [Muribaculaceae bacterium]|nr:hypothetical protein [Muribaculaceae bacterium]
MLLPAPDSHTFTRDPNIVLREVHPDYGRNPLVHFAHKIIRGEPFIPGSYDNVSIVARKQMNLYNLRSPHMNITLSEESRQMINTIYRDRIMHRRDSINVAGERIVVINSIYNERLVNEKNKRIKVYLHGPMVGTISKINRHAASTRYVPMEFKPECYDEPFIELAIDRHYLNKIQSASRQQIPDRLVQAEYAYALTPMQARLSYWDKITMLMEPDVYDPDIQARMMYTGITRAKQFATIVV